MKRRQYVPEQERLLEIGGRDRYAQIREMNEKLESLGINPVDENCPLIDNCHSSAVHRQTRNSTESRSSWTAEQTLSVVNMKETSIVPKECMIYERQTTESTPESEHNTSSFEEHRSQTTNDPIVKPYECNEEKLKGLSTEEEMNITGSEKLGKFLDEATKVTERVLYHDQPSDVGVDHSQGKISDGHKSESKTGSLLSLNRYFYNEELCNDRTITSFDWSIQYPQLFLASYDKSINSSQDPDGLCLIWNNKLKKDTPEYIFNCDSAVMSSCFAQFHPNLIIGGTYSGQIVLWDNRSNKQFPMQTSQISAQTHTNPVTCIQVIGTKNSNSIVSISNDGEMRSWSLEMLSNPIETIKLETERDTLAVSVTSLSFLPGDFDNFIVGSEDGNVYGASLNDNEIGIDNTFKGHEGPITSVQLHRFPDFSNIFLTSSFDWTIKLWSMRRSKPIVSFEFNQDNVYDVKWSPTHPSLFASVDGAGMIDLWNLNDETESPVASVAIEESPALNKLIWSPSGDQVVVGDDLGKIWVYNVENRLSKPKSDELKQFSNTLKELKNNTVQL